MSEDKIDMNRWREAQQAYLSAHEAMSDVALDILNRALAAMGHKPVCLNPGECNCADDGSDVEEARHHDTWAATYSIHPGDKWGVRVSGDRDDQQHIAMDVPKEFLDLSGVHQEPVYLASVPKV